MRLGILTSHPIQYQAPWFRELAKMVELEVFFAHQQSAVEQGKAGFGVAFEWDVDLLSGYRHRFLKNVSAHPSVAAYSGCDTPEIAEILDPHPEGCTCSHTHESSAGHSAHVSRFDAFIVCGWYLKSFRQAMQACHAVGIPVLVRGDSQLGTPRSAIKRLLMQLRQRWLLRQFDGFLSVGQRHREYLEHFGVPSEKIFFAPHFVDNEWFAAKAAEVRGKRSEVRRRWNIPDDAFCVLFSGKFMALKRPLDLVKAARLVLADGRLPHIHLLFAGSGELGAELRAGCRVMHDAEHENMAITRQGGLSVLPPASFAGFLNQSEIPSAYAAADVLVLPSESETWGLAVNEAMACGRPAIVSDAVGCAPDLIEEGATGFTYAVGEVSQLAEQLAMLAAKCRSGHSFATALATKMNKYSVNVAARGTLDALRTVTHRGKP